MAGLVAVFFAMLLASGRSGASGPLDGDDAASGDVERSVEAILLAPRIPCRLLVRPLANDRPVFEAPVERGAPTDPSSSVVPPCPVSANSPLQAELTAEPAVVRASGSEIKFADIPAEAVAKLQQKTASSPISSVGLSSSPISSVPISSVPISSVAIAGIPISSVPISSVPISSVGGWQKLLEGTAYAGLPLQSITLQQLRAAAEQDSVLKGRLAAMTVGQLGAGTEWLSNVSLGALLLGSASFDQLARGGWQCGNDPLCSTTTTLFQAEASGKNVASVPISSVPISSVPISSVPISSVPISSVSLLDSPISSVGTGSTAIHSVNFASLPISSVPISSVPLSSLQSAPISSVQLGLMKAPEGFASFCAYAASLGEPCDSAVTIGAFVARYTSASVTLASTPISSVPISSVPISSVPISSVPISSVSVSGLQISSVGTSSSPISSVPISSVPISSVTFAGSPISSVPISSVPISSVPISSVSLANVFGEPLSTARLAVSPISSVPISSVNLKDSPISSVPISSVLVGTVDLCAYISTQIEPDMCRSLGLKPTDTIATLVDAAAKRSPNTLNGVHLSDLVRSATTAQRANSYVLKMVQFGPNATLADIYGSGLHFDAIDAGGLPLGIIPKTKWQNITFGDLFPASQSQFKDVKFMLGLGYLFGYETIGEIFAQQGNLGKLTLGELLASLLEARDYPWENLPLDEVPVRPEYAGDPVTLTVNYIYANEPGPVMKYDATVTVTLPPGFVYEQNSATFIAATTAGVTMVVKEDGPRVVLTVKGTPTQEVQELTLRAYPGLDIGTDAKATVGVTVNGVAQPAIAESGKIAVIEWYEPQNDSIERAPTAMTDRLYLGHISSKEDVDYWRIEENVPTGSHVSVFLSHLGDKDLDTVMYTPVQRPVNKARPAAGRQQLPISDDLFGPTVSGRAIQPPSQEPPPVRGFAVTGIAAGRDSTSEMVENVPLGVAGGSGPYYIKISGANGVSGQKPYVLRVKVTPPIVSPICEATKFPAEFANQAPTATLSGTTGSANTLIVVNLQRLARMYGQVATDALISRLNALAGATSYGVRGAFSDVSALNYGSRPKDEKGYDNNPCDPVQANITASKIAKLISQSRSLHPELKYLVIVGSDAQIPFTRVPDLTRLSNERDYAMEGKVPAGGEFGSMASSQILTDDPYADFDPVPWLDRYLYIPDLSIGRLVETPAEMAFAIETFIAAEGALRANSSTVTGYDFLADGTDKVRTTLAGHRWSTTDDPGLFSTTDKDGRLQDAWSAEQLRAKLKSLLSVSSVNAHFDHYQALPADQLNVQNSEKLARTSDLPAKALNALVTKVIFSMGCHSGLNVNDLLYASGLDERAKDWAQSFVSGGAVLIGNTGFGYGDTKSIALSERLMVLYAVSLDGKLSAGEALRFAKEEYFATLGIAGVYDEKALMEATFYGLPMYRVGNPSQFDPIVPAGPPGLPTHQNFGGPITASLTVSPTYDSQTANGVTFYNQGAMSNFASLDGAYASQRVEIGTQVTHYRPSSRGRRPG